MANLTSCFTHSISYCCLRWESNTEMEKTATFFLDLERKSEIIQVCAMWWCSDRDRYSLLIQNITKSWGALFVKSHQQEEMVLIEQKHGRSFACLIYNIMFISYYCVRLSKSFLFVCRLKTCIKIAWYVWLFILYSFLFKAYCTDNVCGFSI